MTATKSMPRKSNIELLRIIAMIGVVILHYNTEDIGGGFTYVEPYSLNYFYLLLTENIFIVGVNLFIMISAYFLSQTQSRKMNKVFEIILQYIIFQVLFYLFDVLLGNNVFTLKKLFVCLLPQNYFIILYCTLYIISPYINIVANRINRKAFDKLLLISILLFSVYTISLDTLESITKKSLGELSTIGATGTEHGYSIINFMLVYIIGSYIAKYEHKIFNYSIIIIISIVIILFILSVIEIVFKSENAVTWHYNNPLLVILPAFLIKRFLKFDIHSSIINELSGATFTCFIVHERFFKYAGIESATKNVLPLLCLHQLTVCICIFFVSYIIYKLYSLITKRVIKLVVPFINSINISVDYSISEN